MASQTSTPSVPDELLDLLTAGRVGHASSIRADGSIATHLMWMDWDGAQLLTSSQVGSQKGRNWRRNPQVSVSVVDRDDPWRSLIIRGRVSDVLPDVDLEFIDRMSRRYTGHDYFRRDRPREIFVITPERITASIGRRR